MRFLAQVSGTCKLPCFLSIGFELSLVCVAQQCMFHNFMMFHSLLQLIYSLKLLLWPWSQAAPAMWRRTRQSWKSQPRLQRPVVWQGTHGNPQLWSVVCGDSYPDWWFQTLFDVKQLGWLYTNKQFLNRLEATVSTLWQLWSMDT